VVKYTLSTLLLQNEQGKGPEYLCVGLKALRMIYEPSFGFKQNAFCREKSPDAFGFISFFFSFSISNQKNKTIKTTTTTKKKKDFLLTQIPGKFASSLTYLYQLCDIQVGPSILGTSSTILEPTSYFEKQNQEKFLFFNSLFCFVSHFSFLTFFFLIFLL